MTINNRLTHLEQAITPAEPSTYQIIWPDHAGPVEVAPPGAKWAGLLHVKVVYASSETPLKKPGPKRRRA